jgi:hypothetical protein
VVGVVLWVRTSWATERRSIRIKTILVVLGGKLRRSAGVLEAARSGREHIRMFMGGPSIPIGW